MLHCVQEHHSLLVCHAVQHHSLGGHKQVPHDMYGTSAILLFRRTSDRSNFALAAHCAWSYMSLCKIETKRYHQYVEYSETAQQREERHASEE